MHRLKTTALLHANFQSPYDTTFLLIISIDSLRSPSGLSEAVFLRSASILSKKPPPSKHTFPIKQ